VAHLETFALIVLVCEISLRFILVVRGVGGVYITVRFCSCVAPFTWHYRNPPLCRLLDAVGKGLNADCLPRWQVAKNSSAKNLYRLPRGQQSAKAWQSAKVFSFFIYFFGVKILCRLSKVVVGKNFLVF
jgi:hypothetical protein